MLVFTWSRAFDSTLVQESSKMRSKSEGAKGRPIFEPKQILHNEQPSFYITAYSLLGNILLAESSTDEKRLAQKMQEKSLDAQERHPRTPPSFFLRGWHLKSVLDLISF